MRELAQVCSKCGKSFLGSDSIEYPILCFECKNPGFKSIKQDIDYKKFFEDFMTAFDKPGLNVLDEFKIKRAYQILETLKEPNEANKVVMSLFVKSAERIEHNLKEELLHHSVVCNYAGNEKYEHSSFCNCGLTNVIYALRQYKKVNKEEQD